MTYKTKTRLADIEALMKDGREMEKAMAKAVRRAYKIYKVLGNSIAVWRDGKVVVVPPEEIVIGEEEDARKDISGKTTSWLTYGQANS